MIHSISLKQPRLFNFPLFFSHFHVDMKSFIGKITKCLADFKADEMSAKILSGYGGCPAAYERV